jgi:hypothetical protein
MTAYDMTKKPLFPNAHDAYRQLLWAPGVDFSAAFLLFSYDWDGWEARQMEGVMESFGARAFEGVFLI